MAEVIKINVPQDVLTIEVNDDGDTIILPVSDERFIKRLYDFATNIQQKTEEIESIDSEDIVGVINADIDFHDTLKTEFNSLFGDKAYEKVFGPDILVGAEYVIMFIEQCLPLLQKHTEKRMKKLNKYNANRVGSSL